VKGILADDEVQFQVLQVLLEDELHGLHRIGFAFLPVFRIGKGEGRIVFDGQPDHLLPVVEGGYFAVDFVRRPGSGDKHDPVQIEYLQDFLGATQMADMDGIEGPAQQSPFHVLTCPFP